MKHLLLTGLLLGFTRSVLAQASARCTALQTENPVLKDQVAAYEARLDIGGRPDDYFKSSILNVPVTWVP